MYTTIRGLKLLVSYSVCGLLVGSEGSRVEVRTISKEMGEEVAADATTFRAHQ
jgi:hypothetical protein